MKKLTDLTYKEFINVFNKKSNGYFVNVCGNRYFNYIDDKTINEIFSWINNNTNGSGVAAFSIGFCVGDYIEVYSASKTIEAIKEAGNVAYDYHYLTNLEQQYRRAYEKHWYSNMEDINEQLSGYLTDIMHNMYSGCWEEAYVMEQVYDLVSHGDIDWFDSVMVDDDFNIDMGTMPFEEPDLSRTLKFH